MCSGERAYIHDTHFHKVPMGASIDDADAAAGKHFRCMNVRSPPPCEKHEEKQNLCPVTPEPVYVLGVDISELSRRNQFAVCASGLFCFSLLYGFLQELISVKLCNRQLGLFLACVQFSGYTVWSFALRNYVQDKRKGAALDGAPALHRSSSVPLTVYLGLSLLRAIEIGMTNLSIQYINYPAKTLMKSTRVIFTMAFGVLIARKKYRIRDYIVVLLMVTGLILFMHADANSSAVFHHWGILMLTVSMLCDGAISNISEAIMSRYGVGQDDFIFNMYSIALVGVTYAAAFKGDLLNGLQFLSEPGTYVEMDLPIEARTAVWSAPLKIMVMTLFSTMGFFGASCSAAITKNFGALTMSMTSTARKATTLFLSFFLFNNACTAEHVAGIVLFMSSLVFKGLKGKKRQGNNRVYESKHSFGADSQNDLDIGGYLGTEESLSGDSEEEIERLMLEVKDSRNRLSIGHVV